MFLKHKYPVTVLAACIAVYLLFPGPRPRPAIPGDLRDAPNSCGALKDLNANIPVESASAPMPVETAVSVDALGNSGQKDFSAPRSEIIAIVKGYLEKSLRSDYVGGDEKLSSSYSAMLEKLNKSKIRLSETACKGRFANYLAYVNSDHDSLKIFFCERFTFLPAESIAQTVIHELSHLVLGTTETEAVRLETIATYLGGRTPELSGYNSGDHFENLVGMDIKHLRTRDLDYFFLMNVRTPESFRMLKLKSRAIYKNQEGVAYMLKRLCGADETCKLAAVRQKDEFGISVLDNLSASGIKDPELFITTAISSAE